MYEVEVKVRADHDRVRNRLADLGADHRGTVRQADTYFDAPHRDFAATDEALRVRDEGDGGATVLTYKGPLVEAESKTREEFETSVGDREETTHILEALGFSAAATVDKERDRYEHGGYAVTLDAVEGLGEFVEVETAVEDERDVEPAREGAVDLLCELGLGSDERLRTSYLGLLLAGE